MPPDACFPERPAKETACQVCDKIVEQCKCIELFKDSLLVPMQFEGYEDPTGHCWPYHGYAIEDAYGGVQVLVENWSDDRSELSVATTLSTGLFWGMQEVRARSERLLCWSPIDHNCECPLRSFHEHDAWEPCTRSEQDDIFVVQTTYFIS